MNEEEIDGWNLSKMEKIAIGWIILIVITWTPMIFVADFIKSNELLTALYVGYIAITGFIISPVLGIKILLGDRE